MSRVLLLIAAVACAGVGSPTPKTPAPVIVLVHGRGKLGEDSAALRREWKRDLDLALEHIGVQPLADRDVRLAWYADVLDPESEKGCAVVRDTAALGFGAFTRTLMATITSALPERDSRDARGLMGDILYVVDPWKRCAAERSVGKVIDSAAAEGRPVIVVAYSLGAVVSYDYLSSQSPRSDVHLITLGSPLGIRELRELLLPDAPDLKRPPGVASWTNIYDANDVFAAPLGRAATRAGIVDRRVESSPTSEEAHEARHYLRDRATAEALASALCAASSARTARCFPER